MRLRWSTVLLGLAACGGDAGESNDGVTLPPTGVSGAPSTPAGGTTTGGSASGAPGTTANPPATTPTNPATGTAATSGSQGTVANGTGLPCAVDKILKDKCQTCHGNPLMSGPMPLIKQADLLAASTAVPGSKILDRVKARIHDTAKLMPPTNRPQLTAEELKVLDAYLAAGAPASTEACASPTAPTTPTTATNTGVGGDWQPADSECEVMMELRAHGGQTENDTTPYEAPLGGDSYEMFYFRPTWTQKMHVIRIDPITDNGAVLHHWLLYMEDGNGSGAGTHKSDLGLQGGQSQLLSGWAPGNKQIALGKEVGMQVIQGPNARFAVEFHYNTSSNPPNRKDRSGIRLCLTSKLRPKEAGTHWLGTNVIANLIPLGGIYSVSDVCEPMAESHIIAYSPHMHKFGRSQKSVVTRKDGTQEVINDGPFAFDDQQIYPVKTPSGEIVVRPGDKITTTCNYDGSGLFTFGPGTADEMCYNFVVAWPVGSLSNGRAGVVGGKNSCIGSL